MDKKIVLLLAALLTVSTAAFSEEQMVRINPNGTYVEPKELPPAAAPVDNSNMAFDTKTVYYPNANLKSAINKYKQRNYTGAMQELFSLAKKDPSNPVVHYYLALCYTQVGDTAQAAAEYEIVLALNPNAGLRNYAVVGKDCLTDGPACKSVEGDTDGLDKFINSAYGNGFSAELNREVEQKKLNKIQETINRKDNLDERDLQYIKKLDQKSQASDEEILAAVKVLQNSGVNITIQPGSPYAQYTQWQDPQMTEMSMLLGNNNNNNSNNAMWNMLPMMLAQNGQEGQNFDPQVLQSMMMSSMMPDFGFGNNDK
ncbi:MAG: hypothetical protein LBJ74_00885 [Heliobacteriaceae bacterium]|nr:hypothetical protein [Heliobacteriaceae bacterium]